MKKIVSFMLVIMSLSLYSQQYWQKVDFEFDSGIKLIRHIGHNNIYHGFKNQFLAVTEKNSIFFFNSIKNNEYLGQKINMNLPEGEIKDIVFGNNSQIYVLLNDGRLFFEANLESDWVQILGEIDSANVTSIGDYFIDEWNKFILIATKENGIYQLNLSKAKYLKVNKGLNGNTIIEFFNRLGFMNNEISFLDSNKKIFMLFDMFLDPGIDTAYWACVGIFEGQNNIKNISSIHNNYFFMSDTILKHYEGKEGKLLNDIPESLNITCYVAHEFIINYIGILSGIITGEHHIFLGTNKQGIYFGSLNWAEDNSLNIYKLNSELNDKFISAIEINAMMNPTLCLIGTQDGELYYADMEDPNKVLDKSLNLLQTKIYPQPASDKAKLNFTLPQSSQVSIKLYNTLGIELQTIANTFFSEGLNSIPIDLSNFSDGVYFVVIDYQGERVVEKIVVRK